jgi:hypothetical protein
MNNHLNTIMIRKLIKSINDQLNSITKAKNNREENEPKRDKPNIKWTDKGMFWITVVLTVGTLLLYREATNQSAQSIKAYGLAKAVSDSTDSSSARNFRLQSKSIDAQIQSLKETQREFEAINQPFLQIGKISYLLATPEAAMTMIYRINNVTNIPVKIIDFRSAFQMAGNSNPPVKEMREKLSKNVYKLNLYVTSVSSQDIKTSDRELNQNEMKMVEQPGFLNWLYIYREIRYKNLVTDSIKVYAFFIKIRNIEVAYPDGVEYELIYSNNYNENKRVIPYE